MIRQLSLEEAIKLVERVEGWKWNGYGFIGGLDQVEVKFSEHGHLFRGPSYHLRITSKMYGMDETVGNFSSKEFPGIEEMYKRLKMQLEEKAVEHIRGLIRKEEG